MKLTLTINQNLLTLTINQNLQQMVATTNDKSSVVDNHSRIGERAAVVHGHCAKVHEQCNVVDGTKVVGLPTFRESPNNHGGK